MASSAPSGHRAPPAAIPFQERLRHLQPLLYHMTVAKRNMFVQTAYAPAISSHRLQKQAQQDCMRLHASMWGAAAVSKSAPPVMHLCLCRAQLQLAAAAVTFDAWTARCVSIDLCSPVRTLCGL